MSVIKRNFEEEIFGINTFVREELKPIEYNGKTYYVLPGSQGPKPFEEQEVYRGARFLRKRDLNKDPYTLKEVSDLLNNLSLIVKSTEKDDTSSEED